MTMCLKVGSSFSVTVLPCVTHRFHLHWDPISAAQRGRPARHRMLRAPWPPRRWWRHRLWRRRRCPTSPRPGWTWTCWVHMNLGKAPEIDSSSINHALRNIKNPYPIIHPYPMKICVNDDIWNVPTMGMIPEKQSPFHCSFIIRGMGRWFSLISWNQWWETATTKMPACIPLGKMQHWLSFKVQSPPEKSA